MKLPSRTKMAINAILDIVDQQQTGMPVSAPTVADRLDISPSYLEQLFRGMRHAGLIDSTRGPAGGYRVTRPLDTITLLDIDRASEKALTAQDRNAALEERPNLVQMRADNVMARLTAYLEQYMALITLQHVVDDNKLHARELARRARAAAKLPAKPAKAKKAPKAAKPVKATKAVKAAKPAKPARTAKAPAARKPAGTVATRPAPAAKRPAPKKKGTR